MKDSSAYEKHVRSANNYSRKQRIFGVIVNELTTPTPPCSSNRALISSIEIRSTTDIDSLFSNILKEVDTAEGIFVK